VATVAATTHNIPNVANNGIMDGSLGACLSFTLRRPLGQGDDSPGNLPTIKDVDFSVLKRRPIVIFDDFNDVGEDDIKFIKSLYPIVQAKRVLLFVLVRDEFTANR
jgi:hypothetical protein